MKNLCILISVIALVVGLTALIAVNRTGVTPLGGYTEGYWDSAQGYYVDGSVVIDGSGNIDSGGVIVGTSLSVGALSASGLTTLDNLLYGGGLLSLTATSNTTFAAANLCDYSIIEWDGASETHTAYSPTYALPSSTAIIADCMGTVGAIKEISIRNVSATATLTIAPGIEYYSLRSSATTTNDLNIYASNTAILRLQAYNATSVHAFLTLFD